MLVSDRATRAKLDGVQLTIIRALILYFVSTYSVPAALAVAVCWWLLIAFVVHSNDQSRRKQLDALNEDASLDL